ncbi:MULTISPECIES: TIGR03087 family PEP-CTERM/XrtA system glycosyltransferase [unclassified Colwellia]|uniref:TIGR03087 family PEP-CTERM/XrtA system glycosyltransferase n=1 Tax=unclassified Colwellia TaxID=196834 RepID=UPI0015F4D8AA|nr:MULTISPECIES: TIGR03087 family PEP-CTERM/XrtA system glycosyltransferase [unclassified Colwellia]MBA6357452.1 TIGR03087 family PEP-CTERM/XrtA system glycosyltransferase [Colwellia sp. BRX8-3]MBA6361923.1 TIGR03087 family PEP-CTERM/XrtA system glycosyltransferase [Colwellia sp. BRX8-6]MBA6369157.1 TIGR03087 family PEP-CTERM/XrtA system glycosyltransferase [Colwellia sp. BRX8-5]MBA6374896.1 TIGR03087 family PEP-CTERM/XrtA system glycosyltransferase [Colwellia sp. BRX8-2]
MNIIFLAQRVPFPPNKGEKIRTFNQLKYLHDKHQVSICAPLEKDEDLSFFKTLSDEYCHNVYYSSLPNKPVRLIKGLMTGKALSVANFYSDDLQIKLDHLLLKLEFDAVICTSSAMAEYIYKSKSLQELTKKPLLLMDFMDLDSDKWRQYAETSRWPMKWIYQREAKVLADYEEKVTHDFDTSFFIADAEVELFQSRVNSSGKVLTMGNGMDTDSFVPAASPPNNNTPVMLFTGVMDYKPNIDSVVWFVENVWQKILKEYPKARFIIAGMNPTSQVKNLEKISGIEVTGFVDDILPYYHQSDYFVAPFRIARGVQNKILQGFACGLPVISTPMGAEGIDCTKDIDILIASTADEFLSCIKHLDCDAEFREKIKANALKLIHERYSWEGKLQVLDDVLNGKV